MKEAFPLVCMIIVFSIISVFAEENEKEAAVLLVKKAAQFLSENGVEKGKIELNKTDGQFVKGSLYVFAYDTTGKMIAHPKNPKLIGVNLLDVPDVDGKLFRRDIIDIAKKKGNGWVDYKYKNPATGVIELKTTYVQITTGLVLCCGVYK